MSVNNDVDSLADSKWRYQYHIVFAPKRRRQVEKIEMVCGDGKVYRLNYALTVNQKTVLKAFGIDAAYVKRKQS